MRRVLVGLIASVALAACQNSLDCTLIGCAPAVIVEVGTPPPGPWTIEATPAGQATRTYTCAAGANCGGFITFAELMPTPIVFKVTVGAQSRTETLSPVTSTSYPNGKQCGPECRTQRVTLSVP